MYVFRFRLHIFAHKIHYLKTFLVYFIKLNHETMKKIFSLVLILALSTGFFTSCKKDKATPPVLPPAESMTIDFSNFTSAKKSLDIGSGQKGTISENWEYATLIAGVWNNIISVNLAIPVAAFKLAVSQTPVNNAANTWQWSYNVTLPLATYKARLTGLIRTTDVQWKMYITREGTGGFAEFLWFEGTSKLDGTGGQWILYQDSLSPVAYLQIDWTKTASTIGYIKYTYIKNGDLFKTSYIEYGLTTNALNAYYTIHYYDFGMAKFSDVSIEWNTTVFNGRVKSSYFLLGDWYCWDRNKINAVCQ
jgi:hypothetical protein